MSISFRSRDVAVPHRGDFSATGHIKTAQGRTGPHGLIAIGNEVVQDPYTETSSDSWFDRMGNAFGAVAVGLILIMLAVPVLWFNERRTARMESIIAVGENECVSVNEANHEQRGDLVHVSGGSARARQAVTDQTFEDVQFDTDCLRLATCVEVYQWQQHEKKEEKKNNLGGGTTTTTTYSYTQVWSTEKIDSSGFKKSQEHKNTHPVEPGNHTRNCGRVAYVLDDSEGKDAFVVPDALVSQLNNFESAHKRMASSVTSKKGGVSCTLKDGDEYYRYGLNKEQPKIGDVRVKFQLVPDGPATIMALQVAGKKKSDPETFGPYRMISRGFCCFGISKEQQRERLIEEAEKSPDELYEADKCFCGPLACLCCCCVVLCNAVNFCFSGLMPPQIFHMLHGNKKARECVTSIKAETNMMKWIFRLVGWICLFAGTYMLFSPLLVLVDIIPFLGPYISTFGSYVIWFMCFVTTLLIATIIVSVAYLLYRPFVGILYMLLVAAIAGISMVVAGSVTLPST
jgi:hypothetical protein